MKLSREDVLHVARLARLQLSEAEQEQMADALTGVLCHMESLGMPKEGGGGLDRATGEKLSRLRGDEPQPCQDPDRLLALGPETRAGQFVVPRIVEPS